MLSGIVGYVIGSSFGIGLDKLKEQIMDARAQEFLVALLNFVAEEMKRLSLLFLLVGAALFIIRFVLKRTVDRGNKII
jgi:hypothetical protein